jgi:hypothetical protein
MISGTVLILGMTGIATLMLNGATNVRNGQQQLVSASFANRLLQDLQAVGYQSLSVTAAQSLDAGAADGGSYVDEDGRKYAVTYVVTDLAPSLGSTPWPTYQVDTQVSFRDGTGRTHLSRYTSVISMAPDAGP